MKFGSKLQSLLCSFCFDGCHEIGEVRSVAASVNHCYIFSSFLLSHVQSRSTHISESAFLWKVPNPFKRSSKVTISNMNGVPVLFCIYLLSLLQSSHAGLEKCLRVVNPNKLGTRVKIVLFRDSTVLPHHYKKEGECWRVIHTDAVKVNGICTDFTVHKENILLYRKCNSIHDRKSIAFKRCFWNQQNVIFWDEVDAEGAFVNSVVKVELFDHKGCEKRMNVSTVTVMKIPERSIPSNPRMLSTISFSQSPSQSPIPSATAKPSTPAAKKFSPRPSSTPTRSAKPIYSLTPAPSARLIQSAFPSSSLQPSMSQSPSFSYASTAGQSQTLKECVTLKVHTTVNGTSTRTSIISFFHRDRKVLPQIHSGTGICKEIVRTGSIRIDNRYCKPFKAHAPQIGLVNQCLEQHANGSPEYRKCYYTSRNVKSTAFYRIYSDLPKQDQPVLLELFHHTNCTDLIRKGVVKITKLTKSVL